MNSRSFNLACLVVFLFSCLEFSQQNNDEDRLHRYLFSPSPNGTAYNPKLRPLKDSSQRVQVFVTIGLKRLFDMDEVNHKVTMFAILVKTWKDEFLVWDPKEFNNIEYTYVNYKQIWTPQIQLVSRFPSPELGFSDRSIHDIYDNYPVELWYNGSVQFTPSLHLTTECLFNYARFPFDTQICHFSFQAPYQINQITFNYTAYYTREYRKYEQIWSIETLDWRQLIIPEKYPMNFLRVEFKRVVRNYLFTMPSYIVYMLTLLMFVLPQTSNQRILIGGTCLIIATMLAYTMTTNLPHTDISEWPILGKMYLFNVVLLTFSLIFSAFIINISSRNHIKSVPYWLRQLTISVLSKIFCVQAIAYTVFNSYSFKSQEDESAMVQEHVVSQVVMSEIDPDVSIRDRSTRNEDAAYEKLTTSRVDSNLSRASDQDILNEPTTRAPRLTGDSTNKPTLTRLLKNIYDHMEQIRYRLQKDTFRECVNNEWLLVGTLVDKILFFVYCSIVICSTLVIFKTY